MVAVPDVVRAQPDARVQPGDVARPVMIGDCQVMAGTTSWADRSLVRDGSFYPARTMTARERLSYYASQLPLAEIATTYRFPPTPELASRWADATPPGFVMDVQAWSLFSGAPTWPESLWPDLAAEVTPSRKEGAKLYRHRLPNAVLDECWLRFRHSLAPLASSGRLGTVTVRYPQWFRPGPSAYEELATLRVRLEGFSVAIEVTNDRWSEGANCEQLWAFLEELGLGFVCRDSASSRRPLAATSSTAVVRFCGRRRFADPGQGGDNDQGTGEVPGVTGTTRPAGVDRARPGEELQRSGPAQAAWWSYRYSHEELAAWVPLVRDLASGCSQLHLVMDNSWRSDAVDNARQMLELLSLARS